MRFRFSILLVLLFFLPHTEGTKACDRPVAASSAQLKVLSWNIYMLPRFAYITGKRRRADALGPLLRASDYDVLVLQEAFLGSARKHLRKALGDDYPYECGPANMKFSIRANSGIWILSRYPIECLEEIDYAECQGFDDCAARKGALLVEMEKDGKRVQVLGTHLQAGGPHSIRHSQYREMRALLDRHAREGVPQLVCGDMNTKRRDSTNYKIMLESLDATDRHFTGRQQFTSDPVNNDMNGGGSHRQSVIDYIFVRSQGVQVLRETRAIPMIRSQWARWHRDLADHFPVDIDFEWK